MDVLFEKNSLGRILQKVREVVIPLHFFNPSLAIVFTTPSVPLVGDRNPFQRELHLVFSKTYPSFLTVKEGSTSSPKPPPPQKEGDVTAPPRSSNRYAIRLADHQRSAPDFLCGMNRMDMGLLTSAEMYC